ncbi:conserved hypothetical protein [Neospora caninum Liverpool]|uniref:Transmembrane protein n=1 Tax=Neospora caninum (strain Liverpool) TaxID=572307 RepID=F0VGY0_NEOCL|nr:conserved hypothetical protein [Neospora caninum Liverpool]CBZ52974.1 conserved hypothetical protein [Neospora caninum Liverpool]|eukprot:XP_003883006.1 conserved hypothetical protein [Neospora caninum Liverpool]
MSRSARQTALGRRWPRCALAAVLLVCSCSFTAATKAVPAQVVPARSEASAGDAASGVPLLEPLEESAARRRQRRAQRDEAAPGASQSAGQPWGYRADESTARSVAAWDEASTGGAESARRRGHKDGRENRRSREPSEEDRERDDTASEERRSEGRDASERRWREKKRRSAEDSQDARTSETGGGGRARDAGSSQGSQRHRGEGGRAQRESDREAKERREVDRRKREENLWRDDEQTANRWAWRKGASVRTKSVVKTNHLPFEDGGYLFRDSERHPSARATGFISKLKTALTGNRAGRTGKVGKGSASAYWNSLLGVLGVALLAVALKSQLNAERLLVTASKQLQRSEELIALAKLLESGQTPETAAVAGESPADGAGAAGAAAPKDPEAGRTERGWTVGLPRFWARKRAALPPTSSRDTREADPAVISERIVRPKRPPEIDSRRSSLHVESKGRSSPKKYQHNEDALDLGYWRRRHGKQGAEIARQAYRDRTRWDEAYGEPDFGGAMHHRPHAEELEKADDQLAHVTRDKKKTTGQRLQRVLFSDLGQRFTRSLLGAQRLRLLPSQLKGVCVPRVPGQPFQKGRD